MEEKKKVIFIDDMGEQCEHLILDKSQLRLLKFMDEYGYFYHDFHYEVLEEETTWREI